ncbi:hypothetical protein C9E81_09285 [Paracoccus alkanivorans]|uniref:DUF4148 domain-containing protein n=2 Tax=Paracoccus alkanivorans TaxID=2116655 RepID=A0A3M0MVS8_9RHOB|nr:hypothetical protein C9E81_09285 [Paracoccus alkanivorans]
MKPIFIAGATLLAASGAFAFATAIDHLTAAPDATVPELSHMTERNLRPTPPPRVSPSIASTPAMTELPRPEGPDKAPTELAASFNAAKETAAIDHDAAVASPEVNYFIPFKEPGEASEASADFLGAGSSEAAARHHFETLHQIGVYR